MADIYDDAFGNPDSPDGVFAPKNKLAFIESKKVYRVSWVISGIRKEEFYETRPWANKRAQDLQEYADELQVKADVLVGEIELRGDTNE